MSDDADVRVARIAMDALEQEPSRLEAFLAEACGDDASLRSRVEERLKTAGAAFRYFEDLNRRSVPTFDQSLQAQDTGRIIGPYRTLRLLGRGGMGVVFLAERADGQFAQQVALKFLRFDYESEETRSRFLAERQILARLQHPSIARILDGGVTPEGRPYFAMEYVPGQPITAFCEERGLSVEARLRLFLEVCEAVSYAHRNLVVHRDLKPGHVLVNDAGRIKLLDFGIAKLLSPDPSATDITSAEHRLTRAYAAPEQFRGETLGTAVDVYALGVLLYELLCGLPPFPMAGLSAAEHERRVLNDAPPAPSLAGPGPRRARVRGELDTITLMALRKEPERRYASVERLAEDVQRHLQNRPILAVPDTAAYRASKFVARHRLGVAAACLALAATALGFAVVYRQTRRAEIERDKAERVAALFVDLFRVSDPVQGAGGSTTARELLDRGASRVAAELSGEPEIQASLLVILARTYQNLGLYDRALPLARQSLEIRERGALPPQARAESLKVVGDLLRLSGEFKEAETTLRQAERIERSALPESGPRLGETLNLLGKLHASTSRLDDAEKSLREAQALLKDDARATGAVLSDLATVLGHRGRYAEAESITREALRIQTRALGPKNPRVATTLNNLGALQASQGDRQGAEASYRAALALRREVLEKSHPEIAQTANNLALLLQERGSEDEGEALHREALDIRIRALGTEHPLVAGSLNNLGLLALARGRAAEARELFEQGRVILEKRVGPNHPLVAISHNNLGSAALELGRPAEAQRHFERSLSIRRKALPAGHPDVAWSLVGLGRVGLARNDARGALVRFEEALTLRTQALKPQAWEIHEARAYRGETLLRLGRRGEGEADLSAALSGLRAARGDEDRQTRRVAGLLAGLATR